VSHWPCVTDFSCLFTYGLNHHGLDREMNTSLRLRRSTVRFILRLLRRQTIMFRRCVLFLFFPAHVVSSDFTYSCLFLCRVSVVCHVRALCLNRLMKFHATLNWGPMIHYVRSGFLTAKKRTFVRRVEPPSQYLHLPTREQHDQRFTYIFTYLVKLSII